MSIVAVFLACFLLTGLLVRIAPRIGLLDQPGERSLHTQTTPRGGGMAFALLLPLALWLGTPTPDRGLLVWCMGLVAMAVLGAADDRHGLSARVRLALQALLVVLLVGAHAGSVLQQVPLWPPLALALVTCALLWLVNLYNFMDGINGFAAAQAICTLLTASWLIGGSHEATLLAAAAVAGFLPWNFPRARIFMGDAGSLSLGYLLAGLAVRTPEQGGTGMWVTAALLVLFGTDATLTLMRRLWHREALATAHRTHLYQRLALRLGRHGPITAALVLANILLLPAVAWVAAAGDGGFWRMAGLYLGVAVMLLGLSAWLNRRTETPTTR